MMLHQFIDVNRDVIIARASDRVRRRPWPSIAPGEVADGVPLFLLQLSQTLRLETTAAPFPANAIQFTVEPVDSALCIDADPQLLTSAVMNLMHNAFKNTPSGGRVVLRARGDDGRLLIEVEDECGGIPANKGDLFQAFGDRRGRDRSGLGLGLSIARKTIRAHGGEISVRNMPGQGCVFIIDVPLAAENFELWKPTP